MFKSIFYFNLFIVTLTQASQAFEPKIGDFATYRSTTPSVSYVRKNVIDQFEVSRDLYTVKVYKMVDGEESFLRSDFYVGESMRAKFISDIDQKCVELNGTIEDITVPAGTFNACKVEGDQNGLHTEDWYAQDVPFGIVKHVDFLLVDPTNRVVRTLLGYGFQ